VHFHAIIRLDGAGRAMEPGMAVSATELCEAFREAAARTRWPVVPAMMR
jgi:hypothetical protein